MASIPNGYIFPIRIDIIHGSYGLSHVLILVTLFSLHISLFVAQETFRNYIILDQTTSKLWLPLII